MRALKITQSITVRETESFNKYLKDVSGEELINPELEIYLAKQIKLGDQSAIDQLVKANLRFVISVAKKYVGRGVDIEDLVSEGNIGLIKAAQKFDETRGIKFISYAVWWIRQSILQSLADNSRTIRLPLNQINSLNKIKTTQSELEQQLGRTATSSELAEILGIEEDKIELSLGSSMKTISLDIPVGDEDNFTLIDTINADGSTDDLINQSDINSTLMLAISKLPHKEQKVIKSLFGFEEDIKTPSEVAIEIGVTTERVRQIKNSAIKKLKGFGIRY